MMSKANEAQQPEDQVSAQKASSADDALGTHDDIQ
jgi:hypothetical protein